MLLFCASYLVALAPAFGSSAELASKLEQILENPALARAQVGVYVRRLNDDRELFAHDASTTLVPASNVKIITSTAALYTLGPDYRFHTEVYGSPDENGVISGDLWVRGNGDPSLVPERLWYLASRLYYAGVREVRGSIIIDDTYFAGNRLATGWEQDRSSYSYMAPMGAVSVGFNAILVHVLPGRTPGAAARVLVDPASSYTRVEGVISTQSHGRTYVNVDVAPRGDRSVVRVSGRININDSGRGYWRRIDNPPIFAGEVLKSALEQVGVKVKGKVKSGVVADGSQRLVTLASPRLAEIVSSLNKHSNNFVAEQVALAVGAAKYGAPGTWSKAEAAISDFLQNRVGLAPGSFKLKNGSGLHDVNRFSPQQIVEVLDFVYRQPNIFPEFVTSLAVAAGSGTLASRMDNTDAAHLLRAKTGTLSTASALSGYVTAKSGETLAFSILVNDYRTSISDIWQVQDAVGALLAETSFATGDSDAVAHKDTPDTTTTGVALP